MPLRALLDLLFPPLCHACKAFIPNAGPLRICTSCLDNSPLLTSPLCTICGIPFGTEDGVDHLCGSCLSGAPFDLCRSAALLAGPVQTLIHRLKYRRQVHLSRPLGLLVAQRLGEFLVEAAPDVILPVPLHRKRLRQRGYNQSQLIGKVVATQLRVPLMLGNLRRVRWTDSQTGLSASARRENVEGAFAVRNAAKLAGKRVLLVDDVLTTGSTVRACAESLREACVASVFVVTVARGIPP